MARSHEDWHNDLDAFPDSSLNSEWPSPIENPQADRDAELGADLAASSGAWEKWAQPGHEQSARSIAEEQSAETDEELDRILDT